ncbi:hypothetical protein BJY01DRAFT_224813 [Aspergillus pseudoustus]|uniref:Uncharacterized protein n=1 Tax=Aspergillus pseudoustus TaxID=1810923 RepID=A0ABR4J1R3_9EURO
MRPLVHSSRPLAVDALHCDGIPRPGHTSSRAGVILRPTNPHPHIRTSSIDTTLNIESPSLSLHLVAHVTRLALLPSPA